MEFYRGLLYGIIAALVFWLTFLVIIVLVA
jgi:hypothetical protein